MASTRTYDVRVDDSILVGSLRISRLRHVSLHEAIELHLQQCHLNGGRSPLFVVGEDRPSEEPMQDYWSHRIRRGQILLERAAGALHKQAVDALVREEKG